MYSAILAKEIVSRSKGEVDNFLVTCLQTCVGLQAKINHRSGGDADLYGKEESKPRISDSDCQNGCTCRSRSSNSHDKCQNIVTNVSMLQIKLERAQRHKI